MSQGCCFFTLKLIRSAFQTEILFRGDLCQICGLLKSTNCQNLDVDAKNEKSKTTLFSETLKVPESKVLSFFHFLPLS